MLRFKDGVAPGELVLKQVDNSNKSGTVTGALELGIAGSTDKVTITGFFKAYNPFNAAAQSSVIIFRAAWMHVDS